MEWYNYVSLTTLTLSAVLILIMYIKSKQSKKDNKGLVPALVFLGVFSLLTAVGMMNLGSLLLYALSIICFIIAARMFFKLNQN
ncbi:hypothetical protein [Bacillus suaedae]|uniref:Uncharacterized protein n=1 Tax=Halalkalibacter suaedae TaxID=2822140 RepID=A0A941AST0_9BACI|nr:hypothetical protein [Bacillus suaedae]MBP3949859.1 hypothetical protein [Bacillus suaedae]